MRASIGNLLGGIRAIIGSIGNLLGAIRAYWFDRLSAGCNNSCYCFGRQSAGRNIASVDNLLGGITALIG